jgi:hypothetical protein
LQMRRKVPQIWLRRFRKCKTGSYLMEWMMILARSSSGNSSTAGTSRRRGGNSTTTWFRDWKATRDEVGKEDWSWRGMKWRRGLKLKEATRVEGWRWRLGHVIKE